ncbi:MAG: NAD(P)-binding domain-containing protein [Gammaproteobacteria bacterium]|nr:NAD(P)-binding domain-containing protein [Gammaproteobacteria bacterium]
MNITIVGTGNMGSGLVKQLATAGHCVRVTAKDLAKAQALAAQYPNVSAASIDQALADSSVVFVATGYADAIPALRALGDLTDKVIVDITNPLTADYMGLTIGHNTSAGEEIAKAFPQAEVVKAFNTVFAQVLADGADFGHGNTVPVFYAGNSERAKQTAHAIIESIGFEPVDAGGLQNARYLEPLAGLNIYFGYGAGRGTDIAPTWIARA